jgi:transposase-like protein
MSDAIAVKPPRKRQIRGPVAEAIQLIVTQGVTIADAARAVGMQPRSLQVALRKPHVSAHRDHVKRAWLESKAQKAWVTVAELADSAASEDTRLKAARTILDAMGELSGDRSRDTARPTQLVQILLAGAQSAAVRVNEAGVIEGPAFEAAVYSDDD